MVFLIASSFSGLTHEHIDARISFRFTQTEKFKLDGWKVSTLVRRGALFRLPAPIETACQISVLEEETHFLRAHTHAGTHGRPPVKRPARPWSNELHSAVHLSITIFLMMKKGQKWWCFFMRNLESCLFITLLFDLIIRH